MPDNQTQDDWLNVPSVAGNPNAKGTGVIFRTQNGNKEYIKDIEYEELVKQANDGDFDAYSWVPHSIATEQMVMAQSDCGRNRCKGRCPPGCICNRKTGRCK